MNLVSRSPRAKARRQFMLECSRRSAKVAPSHNGQENLNEEVFGRRRHDGFASDASERPGYFSTAANEGLQYAGKRYARRRPQAVYEFMPQRIGSRNERAALHEGKAVRQFLYRHGQGLS